MGEKTTSRPELAAFKKVVKLPAAIGDWTTFRAPKVLVKKVKTGLYGFDRLSQAELDQFLTIHYRFLQSFLLQLKVDLSMGVELLSCQAEQTSYLNCLRALTFPLTQSKIAVGNTHEPIQVYMEANLCHSFISHALGSRDLEIVNRGLIETEKELYSAALSEYLPLLNSAFEQVLLHPALTIVSTPDVTFDAALSTTATFVSFTADLTLNDNAPARLMLAYPGSLVKTLLKAFRAAQAARPLDFSRLPLSILNTIMIGANAVLGQTALSSSEIDQLEVGDVVELDTPINSSIFVRIGSKLKLPSQPGQTAKKKALRIAGLTEEQVATAPPLSEFTAQTGPAATPAPLLEAEPQAEGPEPGALGEADYKPELSPQEDACLLDDEEFTEDIFAEDEAVETEMKEA